jgi:hypothetical protein
MSKKVLCLVLFLFAVTTAAHAATSDKMDPMSGTWNVTLDDKSVVTWEIGAAKPTFVSGTGLTHIAYGIKTPGDVKFILVWIKFIPNFSTTLQKYSYLELKSTEDFSKYSDANSLSQTTTDWTFVIPTGLDTGTNKYSCFARTTSGPYPISYGAREGASCPTTGCIDQDVDGYYLGTGCTPADCDDTDKSKTDCSSGCPAAKVLGEDAASITALQTFRDSTLANSSVGRAIIEIYYNNADSVNAALDASPALQTLTRIGLQSAAKVLQ